MGLSLAVRRAKLSLVRDAMLANGGGALHLYGGVYPGQGAASAEPPLLIRSLSAGDVPMHATDAYMSINVEANVALSGIPTWARFVDGVGTPVYDCSAGLPGSGAVLSVSDGQPAPSAAMYPGGVVTLSIELVEAA